MQSNNIFMVLPVTTTIIVISTILSMAIFTNVSVICTIGRNNQTMQDAGQSANQTGESIKQNVSDIVTKFSKEVKSIGSNITKEVAKEVAENIGKKLQDLAK